ncbi:MAG: hypothetical protein HRT91_01235 [Piscirickettsiaceae bacterium]|nr:hypothetical protein [Piscirickettsiaceae bacterium]
MMKKMKVWDIVTSIGGDVIAKMIPGGEEVISALNLFCLKVLNLVARLVPSVKEVPNFHVL